MELRHLPTGRDVVAHERPRRHSGRQRRHIRRLVEFWGDPLPATVVVALAFAVVRDPVGRVLLARRIDTGSGELPGGAIEPGETPPPPPSVRCSRRPEAPTWSYPRAGARHHRCASSVVLGIPILYTIGIILAVVGLILTILGAVGRGVGGRKTYF